MTTVRQMLRNKATVYAVSPRDAVYTALQLMAEKNIGAALVVADGQIRGIFSERDYARKGILHGRASKDTPVSEIMTRQVICIGPDWSADQCMALMTDKRIRHLPVVDGDMILGVISIGDVVRAVVNEQQFTIEVLERYITM